MPRPWRLLPLSPGEPARNMAVDLAVFYAYRQGLVLPTLRFYTWEPPAVSCGRFQDFAELDLDACARLGYRVVRRPTGGRAVLHEGDLTYAVVMGERDGLPSGVLPSYLFLSRGLLAGLRRLGLAAELAVPARAGSRSPACFAGPSWYELVVAGRKVAGSAQRREGGDVLQHGSIALAFSPARLAGVLRATGEEGDQAARLARAAAGLSAFLPGLDVARVAAAVQEGFAEALGVEFVEGRLSAAEEEMTASFLRDFPEWRPGDCSGRA
ncbi:MAG: lipoate--protein ligase family protein [Firmicutes bacterium]|nr:lipoate--protein ligase family protein [Bacillota bacterium]